MKDISYMDCWHFVAPLIPTVNEAIDEGVSTKIYVMVYKALKDAEEKEKERAKRDKQGHYREEH